MPPQDSNAVGGRKMNFALLLIFWLVPLVAFYVHHRSELEKVHSRVDYLISRQEDRMISNNNYHLDLPVEDSGRVLIEAQSSFTYAANYGVVGDATIDDTSAIQSALDSAGSGASGGTVILPKGIFKTTSPLRIPGGVTLKGQGYGSSPLAIKFDAGGSTIAYCGPEYAVIIDGHSASLQSVAVYDWRYPIGSDCDNVEAAGGVLVNADGKGIESVTISNIFIYWFMGGTALTIRATNEGAACFGNYQNIKIRHADVGILIEADDTSITNSNAFFDVTIWGGINVAGLIARGPGKNNMNNFYGSVIEPSETELAHIYVEGSGTNVRIHDIRLEGTKMFARKKPLVIIDNSSYGNVITGMLGHTHVQADFNRNPGIDLMSAKSVGLDPAPVNQYWNAAFKGWDAVNKEMPGWKIPENGALTVLDSSENLYADHNVIHVDYLNYGGAFKLELEKLPESPGHSMATFGIYARSNVPGTIVAAMRYESGSIISSAQHSGSGKWEFIGMSAKYSKSAPYFYFSITNDVDLTAPSFVYGMTPAIPGASLMSSSGAKMSGTLSMGMTTAPPPASGDRWILPLNEGNIFIMDMEGNPNRTIRRISYRAADRFPRGTVVTLLFPEAGTIVANQSYLKLIGNFESTAGSSLTLVANGGSSWTEISRNA